MQVEKTYVLAGLFQKLEDTMNWPKMMVSYRKLSETVTTYFCQ